MTQLRTCKICGREVDFDAPFNDHETMEESAWQDIQERIFGRLRETTKKSVPLDMNNPIDRLLSKVAEELGRKAAETLDLLFED